MDNRELAARLCRMIAADGCSPFRYGWDESSETHAGEITSRQAFRLVAAWLESDDPPGGDLADYVRSVA